MVLPDPSQRVVEAVAKAEGVSPAKLSPPLFEAIDPDALDALVQKNGDGTPGNVVLEFKYHDYIVEVRNNPTVSVAIEKKASVEPISEPIATEEE